LLSPISCSPAILRGYIISSFYHFNISTLYHLLSYHPGAVRTRVVGKFITPPSGANFSYISSGASIPSIDNQFFKTCFTANTKANAEFESVIFLLVLL